MQKALFFILAIFVINRVSGWSPINCYDGDGVDPTTWKEVECNLGSCVKIQGDKIQRYCLQGIIMNTCSNVDNTAVMTVSLQTIKTMLTFFLNFSGSKCIAAILTCAMDV